MRAIPRRYFFVVAAVSHSVSRQCKNLYRGIQKERAVLSLLSLFGVFRILVSNSSYFLRANLANIRQLPASLIPLVPLFTSIIRQSAPNFINISIFYTRATEGVERITKICRRSGLTLNPSRPKISQALDSVILRAVSLGSSANNSQKSSGVIVGACGPVGLCDDVAEAVRQVDSNKRKAVGGVELHEEWVFLIRLLHLTLS